MKTFLYFSPKPHGKGSKILNIRGHLVYVRAEIVEDKPRGKFVDEVGVELDLDKFKKIERI